MGFQVSTCPGCVCGCGVLLEEARGLLVAAHPVSGHPVSQGSLCIRGWNCAGSWRHPDRLSAPLIRQNGDLVPASVDDAIARILNRLETASPGSCLFLLSAGTSNEDILAAERLARQVEGQVYSADFSGAPVARRALQTVLGRNYSLCSLQTLGQSRLIWLLGVDLDNYPQLASRVTEAQSNGAQVVSFDAIAASPKKGKTVQMSLEEFDLLPLLLERCVLERGQAVPAATEAPGFADLAARFADRSWLPSGSSVTDETISELVDDFLACSESAVVIGERWLTAGRYALERTVQLVQALVLLGAQDRVLVAAGEANSAGLFDLLPSPEADLTGMARLLDGDASGISVLFVCGDDLLRTAPCRAGLQKALAAVRNVIVIDRFRGEVCRFADVVLPAAAFAELDGTVTNTVGMVQRWRQAVPPPKDARPERNWFGLIARRLGDESWPRTPLQWWTTEPALDSQYRVDKLTSLYQTSDWVEWPFRDEEGTLTLVPPRSPVSSSVSEDYPMQVIFTRHPANWGPGGWTSRDEILRRESTDPFVSVSREDLEEKGIKSGGRVKLLTPDGAAVFQARGDSRLPRGLVLLAEVRGDSEIPRSPLAGCDAGVAFQPVPCRLEKV